MVQNETNQMTEVSPRRMQHLIRGGARIIEFQKFLGVQGKQMSRTTVALKDSLVFYTDHEKPFPFMIDADGSLFCAPAKGCVRPVSSRRR